MANENEIFPVQSSAVDGSQKLIGQLDLSELETKLAPLPSDPPAGFNPDNASRPDVATPTKGPHRYTIYVPYNEGSRINVGAPHPKLGEPGITMRTKTHFHAWVGEGGDQTALSLGANATSTCIDTNKKTAGYALHTTGASNHVAKFQVSISSQDEGLILGAKEDIRIDSKAATVGISAAKGVNISTPGYVAIEAGAEITPNTDFWTTVQAIGLMSVEAAEFSSDAVGTIVGSKAGDAVANYAKGGNFVKGYATKDAQALAEYTIRKNVDGINKTLGHLAKIGALVLAYKKTMKKTQEAKGKFKKAMALGPYVIDVYNEIMAIKKDIFGSADPKKPIGDVDITAHKNVNIAADNSVNISGFKGVAVSGFKSVSISSISASVKGHKSVSLWGGMGVGMKAFAGDVSMASDLKSASMRGKKDVSVTSEAGKATFTGDQDAQLNSVSGSTYVHGKAGAYIGAGETKGYGTVMKTAYMTIGKHSNVADFKKTVNEKDCAVITMKDKSVKTTVTQNASMELTDDLFETKTKKAKMTATANVEIKGKKVLLG